MICHAFLKKSPPQEALALMKYLPTETRKMLEDLPSTFRDPTAGLSSLEEQLEAIHFSWFLPFLRSLSEKDIRFFISVLDKKQGAAIAEELRLSDHRQVLSSLGSSFLKESLLKKVSADEPDLLPMEYLPSSPLNDILPLSLEILKSLIYFLGLHDLALEMKYIIDTKKLKKLYSVLSEQEENYLKVLLQSKEPVAFARMGLSTWEGEEEVLKRLIYQRGLNRLAKACYGENSSLLWHLMHKMEVEQALLFQKMCVPLDNPVAKSILVNQVLELLSFIRQENE